MDAIFCSFHPTAARSIYFNSTASCSFYLLSAVTLLVTHSNKAHINSARATIIIALLMWNAYCPLILVHLPPPAYLILLWTHWQAA